MDKYHFKNMYEGGFYPFESLEEHWAYWSRYIYINCYMDPPKPVYQKLFELVKGKNYFVITTNVDHCFQKAGFEKERLFYTQGDYGLWQCQIPCSPYTYDNEEQIRNMVRQQRDMKIPSAMIPKCPICGKPMTMNLRADHTFLQNEGWHRHAGYYDAFIRQCKEKKVLFLELGVGYNTPGIIKYPFWKRTMENPKAVYLCINPEGGEVPREIQNQSTHISQDIAEVLMEV